MGREAIHGRKWISGIEGQFYHLKKKKKRRNSREAETRDICISCSSSSMSLPLGNNQGCERVTRLFIRELFIIIQNQKELKRSIITGQLNK